jgi:hypothetical protein
VNPTTITGAAGTNASVINSGSASAAVLQFTIPRGATGATGPAGTGQNLASVLAVGASGTATENITNIRSLTTTSYVSTPSLLTESIKIGETSLPGPSCTTGNKGQILFKSDGHFYGCNGTTWKQLDN